MTVYEAVIALCNYAIKENLIEPTDYNWAVNSVISLLEIDSMPDNISVSEKYTLAQILDVILSYAVENNLCEDSVVFRDLFDTKIMGAVTPMPSQVIKKFETLYEKSPQDATDYYYSFARSTNYIRSDRIAKDVKWKTKTEYGDIDITINLSKPEKDPRAIAQALKTKQDVAYPKCQLCAENEGYAGRINHPARQNHRIIPIKLGGEDFYWQYSPYVYYNEHCIVFNKNHIPMKIDRNAFEKLFDFVKLYPHYFLGSNAGLPIVGGSILTHEHFQGGRYEFAMAKAPIENPVKFTGFEDIEAGIVKWPMSVIRLRGSDSDRIVDLADKILTAWQNYTDEDAFIFSQTNGTPHNAITPIARIKDGLYEFDLVLRNNITTKECPDGYYHPHPEHHHIKKENIGLIEVMGLAVLPSRLKTEMATLEKAILAGNNIREDKTIAKHADWADKIVSQNTITKDNIHGIICEEIGKVFIEILEQCGVFDTTPKGKEQFLKFIDSVNK